MDQNEAYTPSLWSKLGNFWHYNKWIIAVVVLVAAFLLYTLISGMQYRAPDANLLYLGSKHLNQEQIDHIYETLYKNVIEEDYNGNGSIDADLVSLHPKAAGKDEDGQVVYDGDFFAEYEHELYSGDTVIFLVESKELYERMMIDGLLVPMEDVFGSLPENALDAYSFRLGDLDLSKLDAFKVFSKDTYVCLRQPRVVDGKVTQGAQKAQEHNQKVFEKMIGYEFFISDQV